MKNIRPAVYFLSFAYCFGLIGLMWVPAHILSPEAARAALFLPALMMLPLGFWLYANQQKTFNRLQQTSQKQRLESSHLLHVISHDIRSPLQLIQSYTYLLKEDKGEKKLAFLAPIEKSVQRISDLLGQVRDYENLIYSKKPIALEPVDLRAVVEDTIQTKQMHFSDKGIHVTVDFEAPTFLVLSHRGTLCEQILCNILGNAFKFTAPQGQIKISAKKESEAVILTIRDNGIGIPKDLMENIFEFSDKKSRSGTLGEKGSGFGLPIAKLFLEQLDVPVELNSWTENSPSHTQGTEFKLLFKLVR